MHRYTIACYPHVRLLLAVAMLIATLVVVAGCASETPTPVPTAAAPTPTSTPEPTPTSTPILVPLPINTPEPTLSPLTPTPTSSPTYTPTPLPTPTFSPSPTPTATPVPTPTYTPTPTPTPSPTPTHTPTPTPTPSPTPTPTATPEPGFGDGTWIVGVDMDPGTYASPGGERCSWKRLSGLGGTRDETIVWELWPVGRQIVAISSTDAGFQTEDCGRWRLLSEVITPLSSITDGIWAVVEEVPAGTYASPGGEQCSWKRLSGLGGTRDETIVWELWPVGRQIVAISSTDAGFQTEDCGRWRLLSEVITPLSSITDGIWAVVEEVPAGTYASPGGERCSWKRLSGLGGTRDETIVWELWPVGRQVVTISPTDAAFQTEGCGVWTPIS